MKLRSRFSWRLRPCRLTNIRTGRTISTPSIVAFCRKAKLPKHSQYHITPILDKWRIQHKGWFLPEVLDQYLEFKDVYGNEYRSKVRDLLVKDGMSMTAINRMLAGRPAGYGLYPMDADINPAVIPPRQFNVDEYQLKSPKRGVVKGATLKTVALKAGIHLMSAWKLSRGYTSAVKGVSLHRVKTSRRAILA